MIGYNAFTGDITSFAARNGRRQVFYEVPGGAATLTGLLSLMEPEDTDGPIFDWTEQRYTERTATTYPFEVGVSGPWQTAGGSGGATIAYIAGATARLKVAVTETLHNWRVGERFVLHRQKNGAGNYVQVFGRISGIDTTNSILTIIVQDAITVDNDSAVYGALLQSLGTPHAEGSLGGGSRTPLYPISPQNYTEIFRTPVSWTATALRQPLFHDIQGKYRTDMRDAAVSHMVDIENAILFGQRDTDTITDNGTNTVVRAMGGIYWFLQQWELGNTDNGGEWNYRPGGAILTANTDDEKRIIQGPANGELPNATWKLLEERLFRRTMTGSMEKLVLGGSGICKAIIDYYTTNNERIFINREYEEKMQISFRTTSVETHYGTLHIKSHPRFNDRAGLRNSAFVLDLANLRFRPMLGRDTHVRENIHPPSFDGRLDEFLTEGSIEVRYPESHAYIENVSEILQP